MLEAYVREGWALVRWPALSKGTSSAWADVTVAPFDFGPTDNVGIKLGAPSGGLVDVDLDCDEAIALAPAFLPGPTATFGRASKPRSHWLYRCLVKTWRPTRTGVELRSDGLQTIFPPSVRGYDPRKDPPHYQPERVEWSADALAPMTVDESVLVPAFARLAAATIIARAAPEIAAQRAVHDFVLAIAGALWHAGWPEDEARELVLPALELALGPDPGHRADAIASTFADEDDEKARTGWPTVERMLGADSASLKVVLGRVPHESRHAIAVTETHGALTDLGNAERFAAEHAASLRHAPGLGWLRWTGARWAPAGKPIAEAAASARAIAERGRVEGNAVVAKWGVVSEARARLEGTIALAEHMPAIAIDPASLDADPWALNVANGTIDLRTGVLREHRRDDLCTKIAPVPFDEHATCPRFDAFLAEVFSGDAEIALYVLRWLGYALTGVIREHSLGLWHGPQGRNGKGTLLGLVARIMGDYACTIAPHVVMASASTQHPTSLMTLRGSRLAIAQEVDEGRRWNEALVKTLTGGDSITAHYMRQDEVTFAPTHKLVVACNARPRVVGTGDAFWSRVHLVPWLVSFAGREQTNLADALWTEAPGVLRLLVHGCLAWQRGGLLPPRTVLAHVGEYKRSQDTIGAFLRACTGPGPGVGEDEIYARYRMWAGMRGEHLLPASAFVRVLEERGACVRDGVVEGVRLR